MNKENEVLQVSDWSQKYKLAIYAVSGLVIAYFGWRIVSLLEQIVINTTK